MAPDITFYIDEDLKNRDPEIGRRVYEDKVVLSLLDGTEIEWGQTGEDEVSRRTFIFGATEVFPALHFGRVSWDSARARLVDQSSRAGTHIYLYIGEGGCRRVYFRNLFVLMVCGYDRFHSVSVDKAARQDGQCLYNE